MAARNYSLFRAARGNVTVLTTASLLVIVACLMFALWYVSHNSNTSAQHTAIEAAALAAAGDIGRIVISDPRFGYVGLCDAPPAGQNGITQTYAGDNYFTQVKSINEIIGTCRLDAMIGDCLNDKFIKQMAEDDLYYAINNTLPSLDNAIHTSLGDGQGNGAVAKDINGQTVDAKGDAIAMYKQNQITGTAFVNLDCHFGGLKNGGIKTNIPVPQLPTNLPPGCTAINDPSGTNAANAINNYYRSDTDLTYGGDGYVFAAVGAQPALVDQTKWTDTVPNVPFQNPGVVLCVAQQEFNEQGHIVRQTFQAAACAGSSINSPSPGSISFSFPDGPIAELTAPWDLFDWSAMQNAQADLATATLGDGDYPVQQNSSLGNPTWTEPGTGGGPSNGLAGWGSSGSAPNSQVSELAVYDWLRCGGSHVMLNDPSNPSGPSGATVTGVITALTSNWAQPGVGNSIPSAVQWIAHAPLATLNPNAPYPPVYYPIMTPPSNLTTFSDSSGSYNQTIPGGIQHVYTFQADGSVAYQPHAQTPQPYYVVAEGQLFAQSVGPNGGVTTSASGGGGHGHRGNAPPPSWTITLPDLLVPQQPPPGGTLNPDPTTWTWTVNGGAAPPGPGPPQGAPKLQMSGLNTFDFYVRDYCRQPGSSDGTRGTTNTGGRHNGADMDMPPLSWNHDYGSGGMGAWGGGGGHNGGPGKGLPPMISQQFDFLLTSVSQPWAAAYDSYSQGQSGGSNRGTYTAGGIVADLRFRREVDIGVLNTYLVSSTNPTTGATTTTPTTIYSAYPSHIGYVCEMLPNTGTTAISGNGANQHAAIPPGSP